MSASAGDPLHPVDRMKVDLHAVQIGLAAMQGPGAAGLTPGMVMIATTKALAVVAAWAIRDHAEAKILEASVQGAFTRYLAEALAGPAIVMPAPGRRRA